jgi:hypothetical protein
VLQKSRRAGVCLLACAWPIHASSHRGRVSSVLLNCTRGEHRNAVSDLQAWMLDQKHRIFTLLPLVFHPITMARRGLAVFLTPIIFLPAVNLMTSEHHIDSVQSDATPSISLFPAFNEICHMPLDVIQYCAAPALPSGVDDTSCEETVRFLSHEKHEVVQLVFFLLSVGKLVDDCSPKCPARDKNLHIGKESQLEVTQRCADLLQNPPSTCPTSGVPWCAMLNVEAHFRIAVQLCRSCASIRWMQTADVVLPSGSRTTRQVVHSSAAR